MASSEVETTTTFVATGVPLAHLLSPDETEISEAGILPTVLGNSVPASSILNVAIAHNVTSMEYKWLRHLREPLVRADPIAVGRSNSLQVSPPYQPTQIFFHSSVGRCRRDDKVYVGRIVFQIRLTRQASG